MRAPAPVVSEYLDALRWDLLPIYIGLAGITLWLGVLTLVVLTEHGVPAGETIVLGRMTLLLSILFGIVFPFGTPAVGVAAGRVWGDQ